MFEFDFYQNILTLTIVIFSYVILFIIGCKQKKDIKIVSLIFIWHTFFSVCYYTFTLFNSADARKYYTNSLLGGSFEFYPGSRFITYITSFFSQGLDANYLNTTLFFNLLGTLGLVLFYLSIKRLIEKFSWYWSSILFIPSMSFWSSGLGKDSISFFATCLFLYTITTSKRTVLLILISFFFMFMVRPHVAFIMLVSYVIYFIIQSRVHLLFKLLILPVIIAGVIFSTGFVQQYVGLEETSLDSVSDYVDSRQESNLSGGSSIDLKAMSYPMQMFTYIFRPLPFDANSALALFTSLENTILLLLFIYIFYKSKFNFRPFIQDKNLWLIMYAFLTCTILAVTTANLGIATRQKWMFMPILIYLLIYAFYKHKNKYRLST